MNRKEFDKGDGDDDSGGASRQRGKPSRKNTHKSHVISV